MTDTKCSIPAHELWVIRERAVDVRRTAAWFVILQHRRICRRNHLLVWEEEEENDFRSVQDVFWNTCIRFF